MIESQGIIDDYYGQDGLRYVCVTKYMINMAVILFHMHRWLSVILYIVFLFLVITIMLNLLIAQMSDTYAKEQDDVQRSFVMNRAWIVAKVENNSLITSALLVRSINLLL